MLLMAPDVTFHIGNRAGGGSPFGFTFTSLLCHQRSGSGYLSPAPLILLERAVSRKHKRHKKLLEGSSAVGFL